MNAPRSFRFAVLMILSLLPLAGGCKTTDRSVMSQASEVHTGIQPAVIRDPELSNYMQQVGSRILAAAKEVEGYGPKFGPASHFKDGEDTRWMFQNMKFHLVNSKTLNAFTTGGEHMYMYSGLMQQCANEDEFVAVVAHEFAHVYCRHVQKGTDRQYLTMGAAAAAAVGGAAIGGKEKGLEYAGYGAGLGLVAGQFAGMSFTREDENEADKFGFYFYSMAGWDPKQFAGFFQKMIDLGYDTTPEMASDHPTLKSRVDATRRRVTELPPESAKWRRPNIANPQQFAAIKARAIEVGKTMPSDKTLGQAQELLAAFPSCVAVKDQPEQVRARQSVKQKLDAAQPRKN